MTNEQLQNIFRHYQATHGHRPATSQEACAWALANGYLEAPRIDPVAYYAERMTRALRVEYITDPLTGRRVRVNHAVQDPRQPTLWQWANLADAPPEHMHEAFQQRRRGIVMDSVSLKADVDAFNSRTPDAQLHFTLILDFTEDVAEHEAAQDDSGSSAA
jgi:hypothetical protein